jgi:4-hydroxyphenylpyruvate dioxygenase
VRTSIATVCLGGTLTEKLSAAAAAGFDGVELFENDLINSTLSPGQVARRAADLGLSIHLYQPFRDAEALPPDLFERVLRRAEAKFGVMVQLGAPLILVCTNVGEQAIADDGLAAEQLHTLATHASRHGLRVAYEALAWGRHVNDFWHAWQIVQAADHPDLGTCLDSFHILAAGNDPARIREIPGDKIFFLQLADTPTVRMDTLHSSRHHRRFPGQGLHDLAGFTEHVLATGYRGPLSLEVFNDIHRQSDPEQTAVDAMRSLVILGDQVRRRAPELVTLPHLPDVSEPRGFAFVEIAVDGLSEHAARGLLTGMGFTHSGTHRSKPVQLWQQGEIRLLLNRSHRSGAGWTRGDAAVSAIGVEDPNALRSAARSAGLLAPQASRSVGPGEARLPSLAAPDGTTLLFCGTSARSFDRTFDRTSEADGWLGDFAISEEIGPQAALNAVDHVTLTPSFDRLDETLLYYQSVLGLRALADEEFADPHGVRRSTAVANEHFRLAFNIPVVGSGSAEPTGPQHVAFSCADIFAAAERFRAAGVPMVPIPRNYYDDLAARTDLTASAIARMGELGILYDRSPAGEFYHLYIAGLGRGFSFEAVQRIGGYDGFGAPNASLWRAARRRPVGGD